MYNRIAITSVSPDAYSETFIKAQVDLLPATLFLHTGWLPAKAGNTSVFSIGMRFVNTLCRPFFKRDVITLSSALVKVLKTNKIDIVLAQYGPGACAVLDVCKRAGIPLVAHFHGYDATDQTILNTYKEEYIILFREAKTIIAVSQKMKMQLIALGCLETKIVVNPCAPNDVFYNVLPSYDKPTFLAVGRFVEKKAPQLTLLAFKQVIEKYSHAKLVMAGNGLLLEECMEWVEKEGLSHAVSFPGIVTPEETMRLMRSSLAFVQHSVVAKSGDSEGTPVAVLEASAAGLPVISTFHGGIPDVIVDGETGILVKEFDVDAMADAMCCFIENRNLANTMGSAGRKRVQEKFSMAIHIKTLREVLNQ